MSKFLIRAVHSGVKFDLKAANSQTVATSEVYESKAACLKGVESVRKNAPSAGVEDQTAEGGKAAKHPKFELYQDKVGRFRLKARNGAIIAVSEAYTTKVSCENGIASVQLNASTAGIEEE